MNRIKQNWYFIPLILISLIAIALRIKVYLFARPFWNDECALAFNIVHFNFSNCFNPLNGQVAPPFFLIVSEIFSKTFSKIELSLRLFPLICSLLSIFVFYDLSRKILNKKSTVFFAFVLFCFNYQLIYYGQEFKQYSSDILIFLAILTSYFYLKIETLSAKKLVSIGIAYAACLWFSFTSAFALFALFVILLIKTPKYYRKIIVLSIPVIASFAVFYLSQHHLSTNDFLRNYWKDGFIEHNFNNFFAIVINYFTFAFNNMFLFLLFLLGLVLKLVDFKNEKSQMIFIPVFLTILLSYFSIYPFSSRVSLYLIPIFILFVVQIVDYINFKHKPINYILGSLIIFVGCVSVIAACLLKTSPESFEYEDIIGPLNIAQQEMSKDDVLYISDGAIISYDFYKQKYKFKNVIIENQRIVDKKEYGHFLDKLPKGKTYYYIFCHFPTKQQRLNDIYLWAKSKNNFKIYADKSLNALVVFTK